MPALSQGGFDSILPFLIDAGAVRGRVVKLGPALDAILAPHAYPRPVAALLAETLGLAATLAGALKYDGIFTLQIQSDGPVSLVVADVTSGGDMRGYARFDEARLPPVGAPLAALLGAGHLAFTVDQGPDTDRYQGIVELDGDSLEDFATRYFEQSEQLETAIRLAVAPPKDGDAGWRMGAVMIQRMPLGPQSPILTAEEAAESWNRAVILMNSTRQEELLSTQLDGAGLAHRLYHAEGLVLHTARELRQKCRCSAERVASTLKSFPKEEVAGMKDENGDVVVVCEFCKTRYVFDDKDLDRLYGD